MGNAEAIGAAGRRQRAGGIAVATPPSAADAAIAAKARPGPDNDKTGATGIDAEHVFSLDFVDRRQYRWEGRFRCHVLTITERAQVGLTRARLSAGLGPEIIDAVTLDILEMQAHLAIALDDFPAWARNLGELRDVAVLHAIYREVASHEGRFWGTEPEDGGASDGEAPEGSAAGGVVPPGEGAGEAAGGSQPT